MIRQYHYSIFVKIDLVVLIRSVNSFIDGKFCERKISDMPRLLNIFSMFRVHLYDNPFIFESLNINSCNKDGNLVCLPVIIRAQKLIILWLIINIKGILPSSPYNIKVGVDVLQVKFDA